MSNTTYMIAILRNTYSPDLSGARTVRFYTERDDYAHPEYYETIREAQDQVDALESKTYYTSNGEAGRPEYVIVNDDIGDYILDGRGGDSSNYNWDDCNCDRNDGDCCGGCQECLDYMIDQDRQYIIDNRAV